MQVVLRRSIGLWALFALMVVSTAWGSAIAADVAMGTFKNPLSLSIIRSFADPTVIRGRDGYWYAYSTTAGPYKIPIIRSADLVHWQLVNSVFTAENEPRYDGRGVGATRLYWAPAIYYFGGRYVLYYSYVVNVGNDQSWRAIGVATAPTPAGPWTDSGQAVVPPGYWEPWPGARQVRSTIDPAMVTACDGTRYLYYGSRGGGIYAVQLSEDGLRTVGDPVLVAPELRYEAASLVWHDGYYYLFLSAIGGCCAGSLSAYPVHVARATHPLGPFIDKNGFSVASYTAGGTPVQAPNGNRWVSVGHSDVVTDLSGQDWLVTHGIDRFSVNTERHLMINRLDWIDDWPTTWAGAWAGEGYLPTPNNTTFLSDAFESDVLSPHWEAAPEWSMQCEQAGGYVHVEALASETVLRAHPALEANIRFRGFLRLGSETVGSAGFMLTDQAGTSLRLLIDRAQKSLLVELQGLGEVHQRHVAPLPATFAYTDWHELAATLRGSQLHVEVTDAGRFDPVAVIELDLPQTLYGAQLSLIAQGASADFDDITVAPLFTPVTESVPDPEIGILDASLSDDFADPLNDAWQWVRTPAAEILADQLVFRMQNAEIIDSRTGASDTAALLLRDLPDGEWTVETKVKVPFGVSLPRTWPQAGLIVYGDDDHHISLTLSARGRVRWVSFGKEALQGNAAAYTWAALGPVADTVWLRLHHRFDEELGEHQFRAAVSVDGATWVWHGVRTLPADLHLRIGLSAFGGEVGTNLTASFDYINFYRPAGMVWVSSPKLGEVVSSDIPVRVEAVGVDVVHISVLLDGVEIYAGETPPTNLFVRAAELNGGDHWLEVVLQDSEDRVRRYKGRFEVAHVRFSVGQGEGEPWRRDVVLALDKAIPDDMIESLVIHLTPVNTDQQSRQIELFCDRSVPAAIRVDTLQIPDGTYNLNLLATLRTGVSSTQTRRITIDNFSILEDHILSPMQSGWFQGIDMLKTSDRSQGWTFTSEQPHHFFDDANRITNTSGSAEYLTWETPALYDYAFTLYAQNAVMHEAVRIEVSTDGQTWETASWTVVATDTNPYGWSRVEIAGAVAEPGQFNYIRITCDAEPGALQLGKAVLRQLAAP